MRGRDLAQRSFVGVAFHAADDSTHDAVYLRPFDFRATDLEVERRSARGRGRVGLWAGNGSRGDCANVRVTPAR